MVISVAELHLAEVSDAVLAFLVDQVLALGEGRAHAHVYGLALRHRDLLAIDDKVRVQFRV